MMSICWLTCPLMFIFLVHDSWTLEVTYDHQVPFEPIPFENYYGNPLVNAPGQYFDNAILILSKPMLPRGYLRKFVFYGTKGPQHSENGSTNFQIWRPEELPLDMNQAQRLRLVWQHPIFNVDVRSDTIVTVHLSAADAFQVNEGDVIGWTRTSNCPIVVCKAITLDRRYYKQIGNVLPQLHYSYTYKYRSEPLTCSIGVQVESSLILSTTTVSEPLTSITRMANEATTSSVITTTGSVESMSTGSQFLFVLSVNIPTIIAFVLGSCLFISIVIIIAVACVFYQRKRRRLVPSSRTAVDTSRYETPIQKTDVEQQPYMSLKDKTISNGVSPPEEESPTYEIIQ